MADDPPDFTIRPSALGTFLLRYFVSIPIFFFFFAIGAYFSWHNFFGLGLLWLFPSAIMAFSIFFGFINCLLFSWVTKITVDKKKIIYESGILNHSKKSIPLSMVTDVTVDRKFSERMVGLSTLFVNTSGGPGYELVCSGLWSKDADELHDFLNSVVGKK